MARIAGRTRPSPRATGCAYGGVTVYWAKLAAQARSLGGSVACREVAVGVQPSALGEAALREP